MTSEGAREGNARSGKPRRLTKRAFSGLFWTFSGTGVQVVIGLLVLMALGRLITPADFGLMGAAAVVIAFSQIVSQVGVGPALIQRRDLEPAHLQVAFTISTVLGILMGLGVWFGAPALAAFYRIPAVEPVLRGVSLLFPLEGLNTVAKALLARQLRFRVFIALDVGSYIVGYACVGVLLAWLGYGVWALVIANLAQAVLRTAAMYRAARHPLRPSFNVRASRDVLSFGLGHSLAQFGHFLSQQGDNFVVGRWLGPTALGIYGRAYTFMVMPATAFGKIVNRVLFPVMAHIQDDRDRLAVAYERALAVVALVSLPLSTFLLVLAPEFIPVILGPGWTEVVLPFQLFTFSLLFRMSSKISDTLTKAAGAVYGRALRQGVFAVLVVVGALIGQRWGVGGVAVAVSIAMGINFMSMANLSRTVTGLPWSRFARAHVPGALLAVLIGGTVAVVVQGTRAAHFSSLMTLIVAAVAATGVSLVALRLRPKLFLGAHGNWAFRRAGEFLRRDSKRAPRDPASATEGLAAVAKGQPE
jgi:O-antigen/teichoic acid export membrane protein